MAKIVNNSNQYKKLFESACKSALNEIGTTGKADLMANCVVDTGTLRRSHHYKVDGVKKITWGNYANYAVYVEFRAKGGRPWFRQTLRADTRKFNEILQKHLKRVGV